MNLHGSASKPCWYKATPSLYKTQEDWHLGHSNGGVAKSTATAASVWPPRGTPMCDFAALGLRFWGFGFGLRVQGPWFRV